MRAAVDPSSRPRRSVGRAGKRAGGSARIALIDALSECSDFSESAEVLLAWIGRWAGISRGVVLGPRAGGALSAVATHGIDPADAGGRWAEVADGGLVAAFEATEPGLIELRAGTPSATALGGGRFHAVPLRQPELGAAPALGLLLVAAQEAALPPDIAWAARALTDRLAALEHARLRRAEASGDEVSSRVREATRELARQNEHLRREARALEQASAMKSQFLVNMSHELRTPLNAILGYTELLLDGVGGECTPQQRKRLERVESNGRHLLAIINDLLDIARIEAGKMPLDLETFKIPVLIDEVIAEVEPLVDRGVITLSRELAPDLPAVTTDRRKLKQIVLNLLTNALKFTPAGAVRVEVGPEDGGDRLSIAVCDTGVGMSAEDQRRIFDEFPHFEGTVAGPWTGTGLGLAISRRLAGMLGGEIALASERRKGSTFTLRFPKRLQS